MVDLRVGVSRTYVQSVLVARIRRDYREMPWATVAGLAQRHGLALDVAQALLTGRGFRGTNLVMERVVNAKTIQSKIGTAGTVRPEIDLMGNNGRAWKHKPPPQKKPKRPPYVPIVGGSRSRSMKASWAAKKAREAPPPST